MNERVQTRNEEGEFQYFDTVREAIDHAVKDSTVWKISFSFGSERVRLVKIVVYGEAQWMMDLILTAPGK